MVHTIGMPKSQYGGQKRFGSPVRSADRALHESRVGPTRIAGSSGQPSACLISSMLATMTCPASEARERSWASRVMDEHPSRTTTG